MRDESTGLEAVATLQYPEAQVRSPPVSISTPQDFSVPPECVWDALLFYEEIREPPPFFLRILLPRPLGAVGPKFKVGGEVRCLYRGGRYLVKQVTELTPPWQYAFTVMEQNLGLGGVKLVRGSYSLSKLPGDQTRVTLTTHYCSSNQPRSLCRWMEAALCQSFHRYILRALGNQLDV